jgi:hypothetical protein
MITYDNLRASPAVFRSLTGFSVEEFEALLVNVKHLERKRPPPPTTRHGRRPRQRAAGAGRAFSHDLATRLLMTLFWLRTNPTMDVLGFFFALSKSNAALNVSDLLALLALLPDFSMERPGAGRRKIRTPREFLDMFPDLVLILDAKEPDSPDSQGSPDNGSSEPARDGPG